MALNIEKRTRAAVEDNWGDWAVTTEVPPYIDTSLVEYRAAGEYTTIDIEDITRNVQVVAGDDDKFKTIGDGYFEDIMEAVNAQLKAQHDSGRLKGPEYARVYASLFQTAMGQAFQFAASKRQRELAADAAAVELAKKEEELAVAEATRQTKIDTIKQQLLKLVADTGYVDEQRTQLIASVKFNNKIKTLDTIGQTYGTFGAGGINMSAEMWKVFFDLAGELSSELNDYKGELNGSTGIIEGTSTSITDITDMKEGDFYRINVDGNFNLDGDDTWTAGELVVYAGERWKKSTVSIPTDTSNVTVVS